MRGSLEPPQNSSQQTEQSAPATVLVPDSSFLLDGSYEQVGFDLVMKPHPQKYGCKTNRDQAQATDRGTDRPDQGGQAGQKL